MSYAPTLEHAQATQLTRVDIVHLLSDPDNLSGIITNCFVRVLLEIETGREDYRVFTIRGTDSGPAYTGFSSDSTMSTTVYIDLNLPSHLRGINGAAFQLNSVSNSRMTQQEFDVWCHQNQQDAVMPGGFPQLVERVRRINAHPQLNRRNNNTAIASVLAAAADMPSPPPLEQAQDQDAPQPKPNEALRTATVAPERGARGGHSPAPEVEPTQEVVNRSVMDDLREKHAIFVDPDKTTMMTSALRTAERDLADYLDKVREQINSSRQTCVVCMDRPPTVVTLPCKHKVLCRLCATQVNCCPCCRETAVELFEPIEP